MNKAIIYIRVSTEEQVDNMSLGNQLEACEKYAKANDLEVVRVFREEGASAKTAKRPRLLELMDYCSKNKGQIGALIVWKVDRFSRRTDDHMAIKAHLKKSGVSLHSVTEPIEDTVMGRLMETMLSGFAQFDNEVRAERSVGGMKKRVEEGSWPFYAPVGYRNIRDSANRPTIEPDNIGPIVAKWLRMFSTGAHTQKEMNELAWDMGIRSKQGRRLVYQQTCNMLRNPAYAGIVVSSLADGKFKGIHQPLISEEEYQINQDIVNGVHGHKSPGSKRELNWPLRGFMTCTICSSPVTGSSPKGNGGSYPKYSCPTCRRSITGKQVSVDRDQAHREFQKILEQVQYTEEQREFFEEVVLARWKSEHKEARAQRRKIDKKINDLEDEKDNIIRSLAASGQLVDNQRVVDKVEQEILQLRYERNKLTDEEVEADAIVAYAGQVFTNIAKLWSDATPEYKRRFQNLVFPQGIDYDFGIGFGTGELGLCFEIIRESAGDKSTLVGLVACLSNQRTMDSLRDLLSRTVTDHPR